MNRKFLALLMVMGMILSITGSGVAVSPPEIEEEAISDPEVRVIVQLDQKPVLLYEVELHSENRFGAARIEAYTQHLQETIQNTVQLAHRKGLDLTVSHHYTHTFFGFSGSIPLSQVAELAELANVQEVFPDEIIYVPHIDESVPLTGAHYLWDLPEGITGEDMIVAILDTGIDYSHVFLGSGFGPEYKVIGGWNFTEDGDANNPMDVQGHGTHVAGIVAADGRPFPGWEDLMGVAPDASLYAVKVLGDAGSGYSSWVIAGMEWAVNPHGDLPRADVLNLSLGNTINSPNWPTSIAANNAAAAGVIVVTSAGNSGHVAPTVGSPGTASKAITVGAYGFLTPPVVTFGEEVREARSAFDGPAADGEEYNIVHAGLGLPEDFVGLDVTGKIALISRGAIAFTDKVANAQAAGAVAVIVYNTEEALMIMGGAVPFVLPAYMVALSTGQELLLQLDADPDFKVAMDLHDEELKLMADFSSAGPVDNYSLKPDISSYGTNILSTYPGNSLMTMGGTSMSAPHVAGGVALIKQLIPGLSVDEYKALLMNTSYNLFDFYGDQYPVTTQGAGGMDLEAAARARGLAMPGSLSLRISGDENTISVRNISDEEVTYEVTFISETLEAEHVETVTVAVGETVDFDIIFDLGGLAAGAHEGFILLTPTTTVGEDEHVDLLSIPVYHYDGHILPHFAVQNLEIPKYLLEGAPMDVSFYLPAASSWVAVVIYTEDGAYVSLPAQAPIGLPAGGWTLYNVDLGGLPPGDYLLRLASEDPATGFLYSAWDVFTVVDADFVGLDAWTADYIIDEASALIEAEAKPGSVTTINGVVVEQDENGEFSAMVNLAYGRNEIVVTASYAEVTDTTTVVVYSYPDSKILGVAYSGLRYTDYDKVVIYDLLPNSVVKYSLNGGTEHTVTPNPEGYIIYQLNLKDGRNTIDVTENVNNLIYTYRYSIHRIAVERLSGPNRFATAVAISQQGWETADKVILVRHDDFADSLAAVPLSRIYDAPILMTAPGRLHAETRAEIERLGATTVVIVGGNSVVSWDVKDELEDMGLDVERIGGANRFATSALIAERIMGYLPGTEVVIAYGLNFPDAMAVAPLAAREGMPILMVTTDTIPEETQAFLDNFSISTTYVVGGSGIISQDVFDALPNATRFAGSNRYATAAEINRAWGLAGSANTMFVATGENFPDALTLGALAAKYNGNLVLVQQNKIPDVVDEYLEDCRGFIVHIYIAGGVVVVSQEVAEQLEDYITVPASP